MREQLYAEGGLLSYVKVLLHDVDDDDLAARITVAVRAAEDGSVGPMK